jgi:hypothetical protein
MSGRVFAALIALTVTVAFSVPLAGNRNFKPDWTFQGSVLTGWQSVGGASWKAENGEIVGTSSAPAGGWLMLNTAVQDVQMATTFRCPAGCKAGLLVRAQKTADGYKGVFVSIDESSSAAFAVKLDANGQETRREPLTPGGGFVRFLPPVTQASQAAPAPSAAAAPAAGAGRGAGRGGGGGVNAPLPEGAPYTRPNYAYRPGEWNTLEIIMDANILRVWVNDGPEAGVAGGRVDDEAGRYGMVGLYVGGSGEVRYRAIETKTLGRHTFPAQKVGSRFRMQQLNDFYYAWSATSADLNKDGVLDVIAGPYYFLGPRYDEARDIYYATTSNPSNQYTPAMLNFAHDFTGDGFPDVLVTESRNFVMYVNPGTEQRRWDRYPAFNNSSEAVSFKDVNADGTPDAIVLNAGSVAYATVNKSSPTSPWTVHPVSGAGYGTPAQHGIGGGDINGDGRIDIVHAYGWWEQPANTSADGPWPYHPVAFGRWPRVGASPGGAEIQVFDVNGDKRNDVVTSLEAHAWGLAWFEQIRGADGSIGFRQHMIMDDYSTRNPGDVTFSELHGLTSADIDGDGIRDIVTGKRHFAHNESYVDPDPYGEPVLYWFRTVRDPKAPGGARFVPELIHNRSGVGSMVQTADLDKNGAVDVLTSTNRGTFVFWGVKGGK